MRLAQTGLSGLGGGREGTGCQKAVRSGDEGLPLLVSGAGRGRMFQGRAVRSDGSNLGGNHTVDWCVYR